MTIRLKKLNLTLAPDSGLKTARLKDIFLFSIPDHSIRCHIVSKHDEQNYFLREILCCTRYVYF